MVGKKTLVVGLVGASAGVIALVLVLGSAAAAGTTSARPDAAPNGHPGPPPPGPFGPPPPGLGNGTGNATGNSTAPGPCPGMGGPGGNDTTTAASALALRA